MIKIKIRAMIKNKLIFTIFTKVDKELIILIKTKKLTLK